MILNGINYDSGYFGNSGSGNNQSSSPYAYDPTAPVSNNIGSGGGGGGGGGNNGNSISASQYNTDISNLNNAIQSLLNNQNQYNQQQQQYQQTQQAYQQKQAEQYQQNQQNQQQQFNSINKNQQQQQNQLLSLRDFATQNNKEIGYNNGQVSFNGQNIKPEDYGLQNINGSYMGTSDQLANLYGATTGQQLSGVRNHFERQGYNVGYNNGQTSINGIPVDTSGMMNIGGHYYANPSQLQDIRMRTGGDNPVNMPYNGNVLPPNNNSQQIQQQTKEQNDLQELSNMVDMMAKYKPPEIDNTVTLQLLKGLQEYKRPYDDQIKSLLASTMTGFNYDPENDPMLKKATEYADRKLMEQMNARGILSSTMTRDGLAQIKTDLIPQYQQIAMERYYKNIDTAFRQIGVYQQLNQDDYTQYYNMVSKSIDVLDNVNKNTIETWKNTFTFMSDILGKKADIIVKQATLKSQELTKAWDRVANLGYVDNETSSILGLPVGTPSYKAKQDAMSRADEYNKLAISAKQRKDEIKLQRAYDLEDLRAKAEEKNRESGKMAFATNIEAELRKMDGEQAKEYIMQNTPEILDKVGNEGYKYLLEKVVSRIDKEDTESRQDARQSRSDARNSAAVDRQTLAIERGEAKTKNINDFSDYSNYIENALENAPEGTEFSAKAIIMQELRDAVKNGELDSSVEERLTIRYNLDRE
jgi:hypothetical protein